MLLLERFTEDLGPSTLVVERYQFTDDLYLELEHEDAIDDRFVMITGTLRHHADDTVENDALRDLKASETLENLVEWIAYRAQDSRDKCLFFQFDHSQKDEVLSRIYAFLLTSG